jgi:hypothetical protein
VRSYTRQHKFDWGIDLHARTMDLCISNQAGEIARDRQMKAAPEPFLKAMAPYRDDLVVWVDCIFTWDLARRALPPGGCALRLGPRPLHESPPRGLGREREDR